MANSKVSKIIEDVLASRAKMDVPIINLISNPDNTQLALMIMIETESVKILESERIIREAQKQLNKLKKDERIQIDSER